MYKQETTTMCKNELPFFIMALNISARKQDREIGRSFLYLVAWLSWEGHLTEKKLGRGPWNSGCCYEITQPFQRSIQSTNCLCQISRNVWFKYEPSKSAVYSRRAPASGPARFFKKIDLRIHPDGPPDGVLFLESGRPAGQPTMYFCLCFFICFPSQPCIWLSRPILEAYY